MKDFSAFDPVARDYADAATLWNTFLDPKTLTDNETTGEHPLGGELKPLPDALNSVDEEAAKHVRTAAATLRNVARALIAGVHGREGKWIPKGQDLLAVLAERDAEIARLKAEIVKREKECDEVGRRFYDSVSCKDLAASASLESGPSTARRRWPASMLAAASAANPENPLYSDLRELLAFKNAIQKGEAAAVPRVLQKRLGGTHISPERSASSDKPLWRVAGGVTATEAWLCRVIDYAGAAAWAALPAPCGDTCE